MMNETILSLNQNMTNGGIIEANNSKKILYEKVEILDESTGQMILKQQARVIYDDTAAAASAASASVCDDLIENSNKEDNGCRVITAVCLKDSNHDPSAGEQCQIKYPHLSIIACEDAQRLQPIQVSGPIDKNGECTTFYRCPMCPLKSAFYNLLASKCVDHLNSNKHLGNPIRHQQWLICKCEDATCIENNASSSSSSTEATTAAVENQQPISLSSNSSSSGNSSKLHYHCPHCASIFPKRNDLVQHLNACCELLLSANANVNATHQISSSSSSSSTNNETNAENIIITNNQHLNPPHPPPSLSHAVTLSNNKRIIQLEQSSSPSKIMKLSGAANLTLYELYDATPNEDELAGEKEAAASKQSINNNEQMTNQLLNQLPSNMQIVSLAPSDEMISEFSSRINKLTSSAATDSHHHHHQLILLPTKVVHSSSKSRLHSSANNNSSNSSSLLNSSSSSSSSSSTAAATACSSLPAHIIQNYSILAQEITMPLETSSSSAAHHHHHHNHHQSNNEHQQQTTNEFEDLDYSVVLRQWTSAMDASPNNSSSAASSSSSSNHTTSTTTPAKAALQSKKKISPMHRNHHNHQEQQQSTSPAAAAAAAAAAEKQQHLNSQKDTATCQFCGRKMLRKNIPTHIRRAHTPKEELVCLNEEQNIFTFQHLKPGQRRKRSARAYDYSLMTATVSIDEDPCDGIENKFVTDGQEILSTDLIQLADRVKYGVSQIPTDILNKLVEILAKIEMSYQDEICENARSIKEMICFYLTSSDDFKYRLKQVGGEIFEKKSQVGVLRNELKEIMARKMQLERRIQPLVCDLQKLEDQHRSLIETTIYEQTTQSTTVSNSSSSSSSSNSNSNGGGNSSYFQEFHQMICNNSNNNNNNNNNSDVVVNDQKSIIAAEKN